MTDSTRFEDRLTIAIGTYADRVPVDVDPIGLVQGLAAAAAVSRARPRVAANGLRVSLAIVVLVGLALVGVAVFGGRILVPVPPVVVSPSPSTSAATATPSPAMSPTPIPTASPASTSAAVLHWTKQDIGTQPAVTSIWRVGDWFVAVGPESPFAADDPHPAARFIRSRDGRNWEKAAAPAAGMEVETGTVEDGLLTIVGELGKPDDPRRGIWTTRDGATWRRTPSVKGLDFGPGGVTSISPARAGWLALARRWVDAESSDPLMFRSNDGVTWTKVPYPDVLNPYTIVGLTSDGSQWLMATQGYNERQPGSPEALTSQDGLTWTEHVVEVMPGPGNAAAVTFGPNGFVIVGQLLDGEVPNPIAWRSADGATWTSSAMASLPDLAGDTGVRSVVAFDGGYFAAGYRLEEFSSFWTSADGSSWVQVDDPSGTPAADVQALAASDTTYVAGGETGAGAAFIWTASH